METFRVAEGVYQLTTPVECPYGILYYNSWVIQGKEPIIIDTHCPSLGRLWEEAAFSLVDPQDVRHIWLSHDDRDHSGNLVQALEHCPNAKLVLSWLAMARIAEEFPLPLDRMVWINPGESIEMDGRTFHTFRPPFWDGPATNSLYDPKTNVLFAADAFGAFVPKQVEEVGEVPERDFAEGFSNFNRAISPWMHLVEPAQLRRNLAVVAELRPQYILTGHGPIARGRVNFYLEMASKIPSMGAWVGPSQKDLEVLLSQMGR